MQQLRLAIAATFLTVGCTDLPTASNSLVNDSLDQVNSDQVNVIEISDDLGTKNSIADSETVAFESVELEAVAFEVCAAVDTWQRPSQSEQAKRLSQDTRYAEALNTNSLESPIKAASSQFWDHSIISFTTYGLSARMEPVNLAGLWSVEEQLWDCYDPEVTVAINEGDRAETWLLNQKITSLQWDGSFYVMTVEPVSVGMQVVQFERVDSLETLPLTAVSASGQPIEVMSGNWQ